MSDLIRRQDAIDAWDKLSKRGRTEFDQVLMTLPSAEPKTGWIPVSERLPDDSDCYLVTTSWGDVEQIWFAHKKDYDITESEWWETDDNPVAWMPLPEPYKGGEEE